MTSEEYQPDNQDKNDSTALDDSKESDDRSYKDNGMSSDEEYEGICIHNL